MGHEGHELQRVNRNLKSIYTTVEHSTPNPRFQSDNTDEDFTDNTDNTDNTANTDEDYAAAIQRW